MSCYSETDDSLAGKSRWNRPDHLTPPTQAQVHVRTCQVKAAFQILTAALFGRTYCKRLREGLTGLTGERVHNRPPTFLP